VEWVEWGPGVSRESTPAHGPSGTALALARLMPAHWHALCE